MTRSCFHDHMGLWHVEPVWFGRAFASVKAGLMRPQLVDDDARRQAVRQGIDLQPNGTGIIRVEGHMTKSGDSFGGGSTVMTRHAVRAAARNPDVSQIVMVFDTPGGHVAGTHELARDVRQANQVKPVTAHCDDLCASAGYFVASQARRVTANPMTEVGSIGTLLVVEDLTKMAEMQGVDVHVLSTGAYKGAGVPGAEITPEHLAYFQERVTQLNQHFLSAVQAGRGLTTARLHAVADGRVFIAEEAKSLGLIDSVQSLDETLDQVDHAIRQGGARMSMQDTMTRLFHSLGGQGKIEVTEEAPAAVGDATMTDALFLERFASLCAAYDPTHEPANDAERALRIFADDQKKRGRSGGIRDGEAAGLAAGNNDGYYRGRTEAAEIASLCQVAEQTGQSFVFLQVSEDGGFLSPALVRQALNTLRVEASQEASVVSHILPHETEGEAPTFDFSDVYTKRNRGIYGG